MTPDTGVEPMGEVTVRHRGRRGDSVTKVIGVVVSILVSIFLLVPALTVVVMSFAGGTQIEFPPHDWGFVEYHRFFTDGIWIPAIRQSLEVGLPVSVFAVLIGVPAAVGLQRTSLPQRGLVRTLGLAPLVVPGVAYAVALYDFFSQIQLIGSYWGLVLADTMLVLPFVVILVEAALLRVPKDLELVAMSLGASRSRAVIGITLRLIRPAILSAFLLAFVSNFDEAVFVNFLGGAGLNTLPKTIFGSLRTGLDPSITAVATSLMVISTAVVVAAFALQRRGQGGRA
ncbi:MAG TPA: ABC transporter permease [Mycobacteriales bacterium]|nr:ABC transporter permease [Mycobacteriales bacterium]